MVFLDHVQNLHIHAEKTHKDFGAHCGISCAKISDESGGNFPVERLFCPQINSALLRPSLGCDRYIRCGSGSKT